MAQKWFQKATVQAALVAGGVAALGAVLAAILGVVASREKSNLDSQLRDLEEQLKEVSALSEPIDPTTDKGGSGELVKSVEELFEEGATTSEAETFYRMGNYYLSERNYLHALELYKRAKALRPDWDKPALAAGLAYQGLGDFTNALKEYREGDSRWSTGDAADTTRLALVLLNMAAMDLSLDRFEEARLHARRSVALTPSASGHRMIAESSRALGDDAAELASLEEYVKLETERVGRTAEVSSSLQRIEYLRLQQRD